MNAAKHSLAFFPLLVASCVAEPAQAQVPFDRAPARARIPTPVLDYAWPLRGEHGTAWVINNYVDLDPGPGTLDYVGNAGPAAKTYDGHQGIDIDIVDFAAMDAGVRVYTAAPGVVTDLEHGNCDRNVACQGDWNFVRVAHAWGEETVYGHMRRDSIAVRVGEEVETGQPLGFVGSSGCSTQPHLHFEIRDEQGAVLDALLEDRWADAPPAYSPPLEVMRVVLDDRFVRSANFARDPAPSITELLPTDELGIAVNTAGGLVGDTIEVRLLRPSLTQQFAFPTTLTGELLHGYFYWYVVPDVDPGTWTVETRVNGVVKNVQTFEQLTAPPATLQRVHRSIPVDQFQATFDGDVDDGYRPVLIDGYRASGAPFINAVFEKRSSGPWAADFAMSRAELESMLADLGECRGYRPIHVDSFQSALGTISYCAVFVREGGGDWEVRVGLNPVAHQAEFDQLTAAGFRPINVSVAHAGAGVPEITSLYLSDSFPETWSATYGITEAGFQAVFNAEVQAGRALVYLDGSDLGGEGRISAIFTSAYLPAWTARHGMTATMFDSEHTFWAGTMGRRIKALTAYETPFGARFAAVWTD